jgi:hypothetical protein
VATRAGRSLPAGFIFRAAVVAVMARLLARAGEAYPERVRWAGVASPGCLVNPTLLLDPACTVTSAHERHDIQQGAD